MFFIDRFIHTKTENRDMSSDFLPKREADLLAWSRVFSSGILLDPQLVGLTVEQADQYAVVHATFAELYRLSQSPTERTPSIIVAKNGAKRALQIKARQLAGIIRGAASVTDAQRVTLGLSVERRGGRRPMLPRPSVAPGITVEPLPNYRLRVRLYDFLLPWRMGKPRGCFGAEVYVHVGEWPPETFDEFKYAGATTRLEKIVSIGAKLCRDAQLHPGMKVWVIACWINPRQQRGPLSEMRCAHLLPGVMLKKAA